MDHVGGIDALLSKAGKDLPVYGPASGRIAQINRPVREGDTVDVHCLVAQVLEVPGHTVDHLAYVIELKDTMNSEETWMFPGDTLFSGGCGRLFEGSAQQIWANAQQAEIALNADSEEVQLFGLVAPNPGLELKMSGPFDLITLDLAEEAGDVWADIRKGFSIPDLETQAVDVRER
eukprot:gene12323-12113_t